VRPLGKSRLLVAVSIGGVGTIAAQLSGTFQLSSFPSSSLCSHRSFILPERFLPTLQGFSRKIFSNSCRHCPLWQEWKVKEQEVLFCPPVSLSQEVVSRSIIHEIGEDSLQTSVHPAPSCYALSLISLVSDHCDCLYRVTGS
jgi:hypothetical protein